MNAKVRGIVAACAVGMGVSWNLASVGAAAEPVAEHYGVALATVGLFTTSLFLAELASMAAVGALVRRNGARLVGLAALSLCAASNLATLAVDGVEVALVLRFILGFGVGLGFVGGTAYVQHAGGGPLAQGLYGGLSLGTAGLAVAVVPALAGQIGWEAPFTSGVAVAAIAIVLVAAGPDSRAQPAGNPSGFLRLLGNPSVLRFAVIYAAAFGLAIVLSNWVVTLLVRRGGFSEETAGLVGALILVAAIAGRPGGGAYAHLRPERIRSLFTFAITLGAVGTLLLGLAPPVVAAAIGALMVGLAGGLPFGPLADGLSRAFPGSAGAAFAAMNAYALLMVVVGTPLVGLTFELPGDGLIGFVAAAVYWLFALLALPDRARLETRPRA